MGKRISWDSVLSEKERSCRIMPRHKSIEKVADRIMPRHKSIEKVGKENVMSSDNKSVSFSEESRTRLLSVCDSLGSKDGEALNFVTLTYSDVGVDKETAKRHIKKFRSILMKEYPTCFDIVRFGTGKGLRGNSVVSMSLIVSSIGFLDKDWIRSVWNEITMEKY